MKKCFFLAMACTLELLFSQGLEDAEGGTAVKNLEKNLPIFCKDHNFSNKAELHISQQNK